MRITATFETTEEFLVFASGKLPITDEVKQRLTALDIYTDAIKEGATVKELPAAADIPTRLGINPAPATQPVQGAIVAPAPTAPTPNPTVTPVASAPVASAPVAPVTPVQTTATVYSLDDLRRAATFFLDSGKEAELQGLLATFGVPNISALDGDQARIGQFATAMREKGANI